MLLVTIQREHTLTEDLFMSEKITIKALADAIEEIREELKLFKQEITKFSISNQSIEKPIKKVVIIPDEPITIKAKKDE